MSSDDERERGLKRIPALVRFDFEITEIRVAQNLIDKSLHQVREGRKDAGVRAISREAA